MTVATIVSEVRRLVEDEPFEDRLNGALNSSVESMTVDSSGKWEQGDIAEFPDGEQVYVLADAAASVVTMKRGHNGTTGATQADNVAILKNPRYTYDQTTRAATQVADSLWPSVWERKQTTLTFDSGKVVYDLPSDYEALLNVTQARSGSITDVVYLADVGEVTDVPTSVASTGRGLRILSWPRTDVDATLTYRAKVTTATTDAQLDRLLALGTAALLLKAEAALRSERVDEENRPSRMIRAAQFLEEQFETAKHAYRAERLLASPPRRRFLRTG